MSSGAPVPQNKTGRTGADTNVSRNATIACQTTRRTAFLSPPRALPPSTAASPPAPLQLARPAAGTDAADSSQSTRSAHLTRPGNSAPHAHTRRYPPTPQQPLCASTSAPYQGRTPHLSGRHRPRPRVPPLATSKPSQRIQSSVLFSRSCPAFPASPHGFGQRQALLRGFLHMPVPNLPVTPVRHRRQVSARIHHMRVPHHRKHWTVQRCVPVRVRITQFDAVLLRNALHCTKLFFPIHRTSQQTPGPPSIPFFHPRCTHQHLAANSLGFQFALHRARHQSRQRLRHSANQHDPVPLPRMPRRALHPFLEENDRLLLLRNLIAPHSTPVSFVAVHRCRNSLGQQSQRFLSPEKVISNRNRAALPHGAEESPLQRRLRNERPIHVEERRDPLRPCAFFVHAVSPRVTLPEFPPARLPAKNFQPSSSTGSPRTTQNPPVSHANTCAPAR